MKALTLFVLLLSTILVLADPSASPSAIAPDGDALKQLLKEFLNGAGRNDLAVHERSLAIKQSPVYGLYDTPVNRESAYEKLSVKAKARDDAQAAAATQKQTAKEEADQARLDRSAGRDRETASERFVKYVAGSVVRQVGTLMVRNIGNALVRGILGSLTRR